MIQAEFQEVVFEFARRVSGIRKIRTLIVFGSVAKGTADARSDVDFLVVLDARTPVGRTPERKLVGEIALDLEKKFDKGISLVFTDRDFHGLDRQFIEEAFKDGLVVYGKSPRVGVGRLKLEPYSLVYFSLKKISKSDKMKLRRALYGHLTVRRYKRKTYKSETRGLIEKLGGKRTGIASVLVPAKNFREFADVLQRFQVEFEKLDVWMSQI